VTDGPYRAVCCRCGFWYLSPRLTEAEMVRTYRDDRYFEGDGLGYSSYLAQEPTLRRTFRHLLRGLERRSMTGGDLLEVGCAYGFFLDEARDRFRRRIGTEFSAAAAAVAEARVDGVHLGGLEQLPSDERFDLVACIHVIEHVYDPVAFVRRIREHLRPGGWLVLATPDMGGFWRHLLGRRWPFYKMPEHVTYFDRRSLARLLGLGGYVEIRPVPYASYFSLELVGEKTGVPMPGPLGRLQVRLPATTVALAGRAG
jgi:2-polyprenyl-3-methyl-5-hydroxy-6-metoxy-1,4-benzoquinol methylase